MRKSSAEPAGDAAADAGKAGARRPRRTGRAPRLSHDQRKFAILDQAAEMFAVRGFEVSTPELAQHMNIAQSLIYKYYESKQALLEAVFEYVSPRPEFYAEQQRQLQDSSLSLRARLNRFYLAYADANWTLRRSRIQMWTNMFKPEWGLPYHTLVNEQIFPTILREVRIYVGRDPDAPETSREIQLVRALHGMIYHLGALRRHLHPYSIQAKPEDLPGLIDLNVAIFLAGAKEVYATEMDV